MSDLVESMHECLSAKLLRISSSESNPLIDYSLPPQCFVSSVLRPMERLA